ncbi:MAG: hypothetical protein VW618_02780 [Alphaproteobacteria bacterium]|jgi:hypothetical protein
MNLLSIASPRPRRKLLSIPVALTWTHASTSYRVTPWPEVSFERRSGAEWIPTVPPAEAFATAASAIPESAWRCYLEFVPPDERAFLLRHRHMRLQALRVIARCPGMLAVLEENPALTALVAGHSRLRGEPESWGEVAAIHERSGVFGLLEWLGMPASRQTLGVLRNLADPEIPASVIENLRSLLWEPRALFILQRLPRITDRHLSLSSHALAA